ncbi:hypothetical protein L1887_41913 [Cichorium endivia]|nr:hypothetical protein L1887_41913 [Cichorium endivia]
MCASFANGDWLGRRPGRSGGRPSSSANLKHGRRGVAWRGEDERREERRVGGNGEEGRWPRWVWSEEKEKLKDAEQQWHGWSFQTHSMQQQHQQPPQDQGPFSWPSQVSWPTLGPGRARRKQRARLEWACLFLSNASRPDPTRALLLKPLMLLRLLRLLSKARQSDGVDEFYSDAFMMAVESP